MTCAVSVAAGSVGPASLPRLIGRVFRERGEGRLVVDHDGGRSVAFFRKGRPVGVNVFARFKPLGQVLLEKGVIDVETMSRSLAMKAERDCLHGQVLVEMGAIDESQLLVALRDQHQANLRALLAVRRGSYNLEEGGELPAWTREVGLSGQETILEHLSQPEHEEAVLALLRLLGSGSYELTPEWKAGWVSFAMSREEHQAMELFHEPRSIEAVASEGGVSPRRVGVLVAATSCFGLIRGVRG